MGVDVLSRGIKLVSALIAPLLVMGGCVESPAAAPAPAQTAAEVRSQFYELLDDAQHALGGQWDNRDDAAPRGCSVALGVVGEAFAGLRLGEPPRDATTALDAVADAWADSGYTVEQTDIGPVSQVLARGAFNELLIFRVSDAAMTLQGESECLAA